MRAVEAFDFRMRTVPGVQSIQSVADMGKRVIAGNNEGNPRWAAIPGSSRGLSQGARAYMPDDGLVTDGCQQMQILVFLTDHEGSTVSHAINEAKRIIAEVSSPQVEFLLAGGNVGVMAASNEAVKRAEVIMLGALFGSVALFCWLTFLSIRAVLCILVPLAIVAILCNALMTLLGIGLKVATLPVMALGVGVGVDYGIYLYERIQHEMLRRRQPARSVLRSHVPTRHGGGVHGRDHVHRRVHLGVCAAEVPGRHGRAAVVHVPGQRAGGDLPPAGAGGLVQPRATAGHRTRAPAAGRTGSVPAEKQPGCA